MGSLLVVSGPPGSGKSTIAQVIADRLDPSVLVEGDEFFRFLRNGAIEPWRPEANSQNEMITAIQGNVAGRYRDGGYHVVFDGVLGPWFLDDFCAAVAGGLDYAILLPSLDTCLDRVRTRVGHEFDDEEAVRALHEQFVDASRDVDSHVVDSSVGTADDVADVIQAKRASGFLQVH